MAQPEPSVPTVDVAALPPDALVLDVREDDEWRAGHVPGALHVPLGQLGARAGEVPTDRTVAVICRSGARSATATARLGEAGWDAVNVDGGMQAWHRAGREMVSETGRPAQVI